MNITGGQFSILAIVRRQTTSGQTDVTADLQADAGPDRSGECSSSDLFDFRNMSSSRLMTSMSEITKAAHLTPEDQIALGVGFMRNALTKVDPNAPDTSGEPQDILNGLKTFIDGDEHNGDLEGAAFLKTILAKLSEVQA